MADSTAPLAAQVAGVKPLEWQRIAGTIHEYHECVSPKPRQYAVKMGPDGAWRYWDCPGNCWQPCDDLADGQRRSEAHYRSVLFGPDGPLVQVPDFRAAYERKLSEHSETLRDAMQLCEERDEARANAAAFMAERDLARKELDAAALELMAARVKLADFQARIDELHAQDSQRAARDREASERVGLPPYGCDTSQHLADEIENLRAQLAAARGAQ